MVVYRSGSSWLPRKKFPVCSQNVFSDANQELTVGSCRSFTNGGQTLLNNLLFAVNFRREKEEGKDLPQNRRCRSQQAKVPYSLRCRLYMKTQEPAESKDSGNF